MLLEPLRRALQRQGFRAVNWRYRSLRGSIEAHAAELAAKARELDEATDIERLHAEANLDRRIARLADLALRLFGQRISAARELCSHPDSYVNRLAPAADLDCGIIAATWDHAVALASTHLPGERDHLILRSLHTLPLHRHTPAQVGHFLRQGRFLHATS